MDPKKFEVLLQKTESVLQHLSSKNILVVSNILSGGILTEPSLIRQNSSFFSDNDEETFLTLINAKLLNDYPHPLLIDLRKAIDLYRISTASEAEKTRNALLMARVNFMGTDGIRGKVVIDSPSSSPHATNCIQAFLKDISFTPELVRITSYSFAKLCIDKGVISRGSSVVIGNDGRDVAQNGILNKAVCEGFAQAELMVNDCGVVPTAIVPYTMLRKDIRVAAMLTASHNPSNQNGIKFFLDGKKLLPEGTFGDYALSTYMYKNRLLENDSSKTSSSFLIPNIQADSIQFLKKTLPADMTSLLKGMTIILDTANGAFTEIGHKLLKELEISFVTKNEVPNGANINRHCGVAEIEGTECFYPQDLETHTPFIREIFMTGRKSAANSTFGIALDGDGDRGFVLYFDKEKDQIAVIDGDKCGFLIAQYLLKDKKIDASKQWFVSTIESDLMTATAAHEYLKLNSKIVSVGDKWIGAFNDGPLLVGLEVSGHLILPLPLLTDKGENKFLLSGIGLLTGLLTLIAIKTMKYTSEQIMTPFTPGFSKTFYTFFVDKTLFYQNSSVWNRDKQLVTDSVQKQINLKTLPSDTTIIMEEKEDPNVLYLTLKDSKGLLGCVFMRNSGTEDKTATYVKGKKEIKEALLEIGEAIQNNHLLTLKNKNRPEILYETHIMGLLRQCKEIDSHTLKLKIETAISQTIGDNDFHGVVHALKKEGRINSWQREGITMISMV